MTERRTRVIPLAVPSEAFFRDPEMTIRTSDGLALVSYDPETLAGCIYSLNWHRWNVTTPVSFDEFFAMLLALGYALPSGDDATRWRQRCAATSLPGRAH